MLNMDRTLASCIAVESGCHGLLEPWTPSRSAYCFFDCTCRFTRSHKHASATPGWHICRGLNAWQSACSCSILSCQNKTQQLNATVMVSFYMHGCLPAAALFPRVETRHSSSMLQLWCLRVCNRISTLSLGSAAVEPADQYTAVQPAATLATSGGHGLPLKVF